MATAASTTDASCSATITGTPTASRRCAARTTTCDGAIDARDPVFEMLRLVQLQADGSQRLTTLAAAGVASISLDWQPAGIALNAYDSVAQLGRYTRVDGSGGTAGDLLLGFRAAG